MLKITPLISIILLCCIACGSREDNAGKENEEISSPLVFDEAKWKTKEGEDYPYRDRMLNDVLYNDTVRTLGKDEILDLLGKPDRINENHLYYQIAQKRIASWPLHTKSMVIKLSGEDSIEWIKVHE